MPASYKAVKAKSCLQRNIFSGVDIGKFPNNHPNVTEMFQKLSLDKLPAN